MSYFLLNIGHDIAAVVVNLIGYLNGLGVQIPLLKILLWPVVYGLTVIKVFLLVFANGSRQFYNYSMPYNILMTRNHLYSATANSIYCFNKTGLAIFLADFYFMQYFHNKLLRRHTFTYVFYLCKIVSTLMPFLTLSPVQRLPFWVLGLGLTLYEIPLGLFMIISWGYGIDWAQGQFYRHWPKHYRYRYASGNRQLTVELSCYAYVISKFLILFDYFCYNPTRNTDRLNNPHEPTKGAAFNSDGVSLYGNSGIHVTLLFCAALIALGVYALLLKRTFYNPKTYMSKLSFLIKLKTYLLKFLELSSRGAADRLLLNSLSVPPRPFPFVSACKDKLSCTPALIFASSGLTFASVSPDLDYLNALVEQDTVANLRYGILFLLALSSLGVYSIILAGWSSNSKYAFIGALRSAAQMISYEVAISLIILPVVIFAGSLNLTMITYVQHITTWFLFPLLPIALLFLIAMLAETNRTPFDLPEAEAELVAGYNVDYSSLPFAMFFLGEYCNMILISTLFCLLFLSGGLNSLSVSSAVILACKAAVTWVFFVLVRATLPRYRYDQLMDIGWKVFLPVSGSFLLFIFGVLVFFNGLPVTSELPMLPPFASQLSPL